MLPIRNAYNHSWLPDLFNDIFENDWTFRTNHTAPAVNVSEEDDCYQVEIAAPGMTKDDFKIYLADDDHLAIAIEKKQESQDENKKYLRREFSYAKYEQTMVLPDNVDREKITAAVHHGILTISLPKTVIEDQPREPKMIDIL